MEPLGRLSVLLASFSVLSWLVPFSGQMLAPVWVDAQQAHMIALQSGSGDTGSPQPPTLLLQPQHPIYIQGEEVALVCSAPAWVPLAEYAFYEEQGEQGGTRRTILQVQQPQNQNHTFRLGGATAGTFHCVYWILQPGQEMQTSPRSNSVSVVRTDPPSPPVLEVSPPPKAVYEGEPLLLSCVSSSRNAEKWFHFSRDGVEMDSSHEESRRGSREPGYPSPEATWRIPQFNSSHSGAFACSYEENVSGRWVPSPWSQKVDITVQPRDSSVPVLMYVRLTLVLLIPMISLLCYYHQRRKRVSKGPEAFQPQESKKETEFIRHGKFEPQMAALQLQRRETVEEDRLSYCEIRPTPRLTPGEVGRVSYREIQFPPTSESSKMKR